MSPVHRYRLGLGVIEAFLNERSAIVHWLRPSVRETEPEPPVRVEPVDPEEGWFLGVAFMGVLVGVGMLLGWAT